MHLQTQSHDKTAEKIKGCVLFLTFIIYFKSMGAYSKVAGKTQGKNGSGTCDRSWHLESC